MNCIDCIYCIERYKGYWCDYFNRYVEPETDACSFYREDEDEEDQ